MEKRTRKKERKKETKGPEGNPRPPSIVSLSHRTTIGSKNGTHRVVGCAGRREGRGRGGRGGLVVEGWLARGMVDEGGTCLLLAPSPGAIVTIRGNIGKSIWLPLPSSLSPPLPALSILSLAPLRSDFDSLSALASSRFLVQFPLLLLTPFNPLSVSFPVGLPRSARTGEPIMRGCYSGPIPNHPERETEETRVQEGRMCVARATGWVV